MSSSHLVGTVALEMFLDIITSVSCNNIKKLGHQEMYVDAGLVLFKFNEIFENHPNLKFNSAGLFIRSVNRYMIKKSKHYISTLQKKLNRQRRSFIIFYDSDRYNNEIHKESDVIFSEMYPIVISEYHDNRIKFITSINNNHPGLNALVCVATATQTQPISIVPLTPPNTAFTTTSLTIRTSHPEVQNTIPSETPTDIPAYPLLNSLQIDTNFNNNQEQIENLLSELVSLYKNEKKSLEFTHRGNNRKGLLISIPRAKTYESYDKNEKRQKWLESIFCFLTSHNNFTFDECFQWMLKNVYKKHPHIFIKFATDIGLVISQKMSKVEAAAMWVEANISVKSAQIILRHLHHKFKHRLQVPFSAINNLSNINGKLQPMFGVFKYVKTTSKVPELIKYWTIDPMNLIEYDFARVLMAETIETPKFGYSSSVFPTNQTGVICIIGADHGAGKSRYLIRTNYLPSSHRRERNKVDAGTRTSQFAQVTCKKDVVEVQSKIAPVVNKAIKGLENSKLVAIKIGPYIKCKFLPIDAQNIHASIRNMNLISLQYTLPQSPRSHSITITTDDSLHLTYSVKTWTIIEGFKCVIAGDLSFFSTSTGRDGHSHCRCTYCDSSYSLWNDPTSESPTPMSLALLHRFALQYSNSTSKKSPIPKE